MDKKYDTRENIKKILKYWILYNTQRRACALFL
jgi:hypothetical protein